MFFRRILLLLFLEEVQQKAHALLESSALRELGGEHAQTTMVLIFDRDRSSLTVRADRLAHAW